jgi:hypothetical protein
MNKVDNLIAELKAQGIRAGESETAMRYFAKTLSEYARADAKEHIDLLRAAYEKALAAQAEVFATQLAHYIRRVAELESKL